MKLGIIFKKEFRNTFGEKKEFFSSEITIKQEVLDYEPMLTIQTYDITKADNIFDKFSAFMQSFPAKAIQLIYFGEWNK